MRVQRGGTTVELASIDKEDLLRQVRAGEFAGSLEFDAITFLQIAGVQNRNFVRFKESKLGKLAKSGARNPFLRDHGQRKQEDRGGTVLKTEVIDHAGGKALRQTIQAVKLWAIEGLLDGTIDRFSIGWYPTGPILCSICDQHYHPYGWPSCSHWPGDEVPVGEGKETKIAEAIYTDAELVEVSAVNVPAVLGTRIDQIRAALGLAPLQGKPPDRSHDMDEFEKKAAELEVQLAAEREAHTSTKTALAALKAQIDAIEAAKGASERQALIDRAYAEGRVICRRDDEGKVLDGPIEKFLREAPSLAAAQQFLESIPKGTIPVAVRLQSQEKDAAPRAGKVKKAAMQPAGGKVLKQLGVSLEDVEKYGKVSASEDTDTDDEDDEDAA